MNSDDNKKKNKLYLIYMYQFVFCVFLIYLVLTKRYTISYILGYVVFYFFAYYVLHRLSHRVHPVFSPFHYLHHQDDVHPFVDYVEQFGMSLIYHIIIFWVLLRRPLPWDLSLPFILLFISQHEWSHLEPTMSFIEYYHMKHHDSGGKYNYGPLPLFDQVFGTYQ